MNKKEHLKSLEYLYLLKKINDIVETDFCAEMGALTLPDSREYTQEEAKKMAEKLGIVYLYAHQIHCKAHNTKQNIFLKGNK